MEQRLMLRSNLRRGCHRRHRFDALALNRHQQPQAVIMHRLLSIDMAKRAPRHRPQIALHSPHSIRRPFRPPFRMKIGQITISCGCYPRQIHNVGFCDSVRLTTGSRRHTTTDRPREAIRMSSKEELKRAVCETIDRHANAIIDLGETILRHPETGFNEVKTAALVGERMNSLGLKPRTGLALTGVKGRLPGRAPGPRLAFIGELDSLRTSEHPLADPVTGAAHSCGHNAQIAGMLGAAIGLT